MPVLRSSYHHGNLRAALTDAALDLARRGGPASVTVRGAARRVGVTPPAAYRHFAEVGELRAAARDRALTLLAARLDDPPRPVAGTRRRTTSADPVAAAAAGVRAVAEGYIGFARTSPGLFAMACDGTLEAIRALTADRLRPLLDALPSRSAQPAAGPGLVFTLWSAMHALAVLAVEGAPGEVSAQEVLDTVLAWIAYQCSV